MSRSLHQYNYSTLYQSMGTFILCCCLTLTGHAADNQVSISQENFTHLGVLLGKLETADQTPLLSAPATVIVPPAKESVVNATQAGFIEKLTAAVGDRVTKGQVLSQINSPDLVVLQKDYLQALNTLQLSTAVYQRDKKLLEEGVIADRNWQETSSQYHTALSDADSQKQLLILAGMNHKGIQQLAKTHQLTRQLAVRATLTGVILERLVVLGAHVDPMAPLYRIADLSELWLEMAIPQERINNIHLGDLVTIENSTATAAIILLGQQVNPDNQTVMARAKLSDPAHSQLRPGQRLNIHLIQPSQQPSFKVPNVAIAQNEGKAYIFVRNTQGFTVTPVTIVGKEEQASIIHGALTGNEEIAIKGAVALKANWLGLGSEE